MSQVVPVDPAHVTVNAHWLGDQVAAHVGDRVHVSFENPEALGTAGAVGQVVAWLAGRDLLITNGDGWYDPAPDLTSFVEDWDHQCPRLLVIRDKDRSDFDGGWRFAGISLLPGSVAAALQPVPSGLHEVVWSRMPVDLVPTDVTFIDCGTFDDLAQARSQAPDQRRS